VKFIFASQEEREREMLETYRDLYDKRLRLYRLTLQAMNTKSPTRRKELYYKWREQYGDNYARSYAKFAEACIAGAVKLDKIKSSLEGGRP
jgi:hypothetical protein